MRFFSNDITGVDIGAGSIKVVRLSRGGNRPKLLSAMLVELSPDPALAASISGDLRQLRADKKIGGANVVTLMPGKHLTIRALTLPKMPPNELREAVRWEAKRHISYSVDSAQVEYLIVNERQEGVLEKYDIVMVAAERAKVLEQLAPFNAAKIKVSAVDANALALRNVLRTREIPADENTLVVDLGAGKTEVTIFKGGDLRFSRCVESGGLDMTRAVAEALNIGFQEAEDKKRALNILTPPDQDPAIAALQPRVDGLLMEIRRSVEYYKTTFREKSVEGMILSGGVSLMPGLKDYFAQSLEGAVELDRPFDGLTCKKNMLDEFGPVAPRFSAAIGLALRKM
ncbi:MAG: type IV pilus assembly protein PilM [Nitrospirae bacterium]|nr:type IV pilus assembly protein PilM [Nitrospirota bacterium]